MLWICLSYIQAVYESADAVETILGILEARLKSLNLSTITNDQGDSLLHVAARSSSPSSESVMTLLIERELKLLELENKDKRTPLHVAAYGKLYLYTKQSCFIVKLGPRPSVSTSTPDELRVN